MHKIPSGPWSTAIRNEYGSRCHSNIAGNDASRDSHAQLRNLTANLYSSITNLKLVISEVLWLVCQQIWKHTSKYENISANTIANTKTRQQIQKQTNKCTMTTTLAATLKMGRVSTYWMLCACYWLDQQPVNQPTVVNPKVHPASKRYKEKRMSSYTHWNINNRLLTHHLLRLSPLQGGTWAPASGGPTR